MANAIYKWRIWCNTDNKWVEGWSEIAPTTCFENNTHTIDSTKTSIIETITETLPLSEDKTKIIVHSTPRPILSNSLLFSYWTSAGDNLTTHGIGDGPLTIFSLTPGVASQSINMEFDPIYGKVFIHEGYFMCQGAGLGDYVNAEIIAHASPISTGAPNLDLVLDNDNYVLYSSGGPGTGTHGFTGTPHLLPRTYSKDGDWDYNGTALTPNFTKTGGYKININEFVVHRLMNHIALLDNGGYLRMASVESTELPPGYFIKITCHNVSNTTWQGTAMITAFRDCTAHP